MLRVEKARGCGKMLHGCPQFSGLSLKKIILIENNNNLKKILLRCVSGGCWFGRGHFRGQHAVFLKARSRAEWLTAAFEVPSFPASNHWEAGWMERQRGGGTGRE